MTNNFLISASHIQKSFGDLKAVDGVSLQIKAGEIYGLVGADGAGKTTTMRLLVGALKADSGNVTICGFDVSKEVENARAQVGYLSQRFSLYEDLTVLENIRFFAEVRGLKSNEWLPRCMEILEFVGLDQFTDRRAGQLSGGMKQKLGLCAALIHDPDLLILDEPTRGIDIGTKYEIYKLIDGLIEQGKAVLLVSSELPEILALSDRILVMRDGELVGELAHGQADEASILALAAQGSLIAERAEVA